MKKWEVLQQQQMGDLRTNSKNYHGICKLFKQKQSDVDTKRDLNECK